MSQRQNLNQPMLGILASSLAILLALGISAAVGPVALTTWVSFLVICAIPTQMLIDLVWHNDYPGFLHGRAQPIKGLVILGLLLMAVAGVAPVTFFTLGGGISPPLPFLIMFIILSVVTTIWAIIVWQCWPLSAISRHPAWIGLGTLLLAYLAAWALFRWGFDFAFLAQAPFYRADLDPSGAFMAWDALGFALTTAAVVMGLVLLEFWPLNLVARAVPRLGAQPLWGVLVSVLVLGISMLCWWLGREGLGMGPVDYLVRGPVSLLFGEFVVLVMLQSSPFATQPQPLQGLAKLLLSLSLGLALYQLYLWAGRGLTGGLPSGAPSYAEELWLASAMLSVTFPLMVAMANGFAFWPLRRSCQDPSAAKTTPVSESL